MIYYRGHIVYVVTASYPDDAPVTAPVTAVVRTADRRDVSQGEKLGVISEGRCIPLSEYERREVARGQNSVAR